MPNFFTAYIFLSHTLTVTTSFVFSTSEFRLLYLKTRAWTLDYHWMIHLSVKHCCCNIYPSSSVLCAWKFYCMLLSFYKINKNERKPKKIRVQRNVVFKTNTVKTKMKNHEVSKLHWGVASIRYIKILTGLKLTVRNCEPKYTDTGNTFKDYGLNDEMSLGIFFFFYSSLNSLGEKNSPITYHFAFYFQKCVKY